MRSRHALHVGLVVSFAVVAATVGGPVTAAAATDPAVVVNLAADSGRPPSGVGRGFLYGLSFDGSRPTDEYLRPLEPESFRSGGEIDEPGSFGWGAGPEQFGPRYEAFRDQAVRVTRAPYSATMDMLVSDLWGSDGSGIRPKDLAEPCDDGPDCANWKAFLGELIGRLGADGLLNDRVRFDVWNEPAANSYFWPRSIEQYYQMWDTAVTTIRSLYPDAVIVGPSSPDYHGPTQQSFLDQAFTAGTMPDVWNWHFSVDPVADETDFRARLAAKGIADMPISINEYLRADQQNPGYTAWYLARLQRSGISSASHAIWSSCCGAGLLDGVVVSTSDGTVDTTGSYWVYAANARARGDVVSLQPAAGVDGIATRDDTSRTVQVTLGTQGYTGSLPVRITGFDDRSAPGGAVTVQVERLVDGEQSAPAAVLSQNRRLDGTTLDVTIPWQSASDAYVVTVTPLQAGAGSIDAADTGGSVGHFTYGPGWVRTDGVAGLYAGTANRSTGAGQSAMFSFTGTSAQLYAVRDTDQGVMELSVDGAPAQRVDDYGPSRQAPALVWEVADLDPGTHVVTVRATGEANPASSGSTVTLDRVEVASTVRVIDADLRGPGSDGFGYAGGGVAQGVADMYAGTADWLQPGDTATLRFQGRQVWIYGVRDRDQGAMRLSVDGASPVVVDDYAPAREASALLWSSGTLTPGAHTVTIEAIGRRSSASTGQDIALDRAAFDQRNPVSTVDANVFGTGPGQWEYSAGWGSTSGVGDMYAGTARWSPTAGSTATFRFEGTQVAVRAVRDTDQGIATVRLDGTVAATIDDYSPTRDGSAVVWDSGPLAAGPHTVVVTVAGQRNPASAGATIALDAADVTADLDDSSTQRSTVDANVFGTGPGQWEYSAGWGSTSGVGDMYAGTARWSPTAGSTATFRFEGTQVAVRAVRDTDQGIATVRLDGADPVTVDDYSATRNGSAVVWDSGQLSAGAHTVVVTVTGQRNSASSGSTIALDAADVSVATGPAVPTQPVASDVRVQAGFGAAPVLVPPAIHAGVATGAEVTAQGIGGTAHADGMALWFEPSAGFSGTASFRYRVTGPAGTSEPAVATVVVADPPDWDPAAVYDTGQYVRYDGANYLAQWWDSGHEPGASPWGAWAMVGQPTGCGTGVAPAWTDSWTYLGGEQVAYAGHAWTAQWWTRDQVPGSPWGPWLDLGAC